MSYTICRKFRIDAGHRVYKHEGKCASLHGHSYEFWVYVTKEKLDPLSRIVDYSVLKETIGQWLEDHWDHAMLLCLDDPIILHWAPGGAFAGQKYYALHQNPTAENLARTLLEIASDLLHSKELRVERVVCWETPNCMAEATW